MPIKPAPNTATSSASQYIVDLLQVDLMNFRIEYVRPDEGLFRKSKYIAILTFNLWLRFHDQNIVYTALRAAIVFHL